MRWWLPKLTNRSEATPHQSTALTSPLMAMSVVATAIATSTPAHHQPMVATATPGRSPGGATVLEKAPERVRQPQRRYKVLLHNDPVNTMEYVVTTLRQVVPSLSEQDAMAVMLEAHNTGVGLVIVCDIEPAEFYCESLKAKGLTSTIEPEE
jgi:ATP-dependent Clp protease adaptor protein ClpS